MFSMGSVSWRQQAIPESDSWEVGQFSTSQYETRREVNASELVTRQEARKQDSELGLGAHKKIRSQPVKN
jgi:hypothetical protein